MRAWNLPFLIALSAVGVGWNAQAESVPGANASTSLDSGEINRDPLRGLIINRTVTTLGWDFYKSFSGIWQALHPDSEFTLTITERPTAQFGSEIWVSYRNTTLYHAFLPPARSRVNETAKKAAEIAFNGVEEIEQQEKVLSKDSDLAPSEY